MRWSLPLSARPCDGHRKASRITGISTDMTWPIRATHDAEVIQIVACGTAFWVATSIWAREARPTGGPTWSTIWNYGPGWERDLLAVLRNRRQPGAHPHLPEAVEAGTL